jgi:NAD(P)H-nitrite reductase large subunit
MIGMENIESRIICRCRHVSENDIIAAVNKGARTYTELQRMTGAVGGCKSCFQDVMKYFQLQIRAKKQR